MLAFLKTSKSNSEAYLSRGTARLVDGLEIPAPPSLVLKVIRRQSVMTNRQG